MKKVFGWFLLIIGVLLIGWGIWSSYEIFTTRRPAPEIFKIREAQEISMLPEKTGKDLQIQMQQQMEKTFKEQLEKLLPPDFLPKLFNLIAWSIFMFILVFAGGKLSFIGIRLLKA